MKTFSASNTNSYRKIKMSEAGESIITEMEEALAFVKGEKVDGAVVHIPDEIDVKRFRKN